MKNLLMDLEVEGEEEQEEKDFGDEDEVRKLCTFTIQSMIDFSLIKILKNDNNLRRKFNSNLKGCWPLAGHCPSKCRFNFKYTKDDVPSMGNSMNARNQ